MIGVFKHFSFNPPELLSGLVFSLFFFQTDSFASFPFENESVASPLFPGELRGVSRSGSRGATFRATPMPFNDPFLSAGYLL